MCKISWEKLSVTSRRGPPTSRRQNPISLSRRDVRFHVATSFLKLSVTSRREISRRDVKMSSLCHVATCIFTSRCHFNTPLSRCGVYFHVATSNCKAICHVATWPRTSRRRLVMCSVTSRREPERRDVGLFSLCDVATSPRTSRRDPVFSPRIGHCGTSPPTPIT